MKAERIERTLGTVAEIPQRYDHRCGIVLDRRNFARTVRSAVPRRVEREHDSILAELLHEREVLDGRVGRLMEQNQVRRLLVAAARRHRLGVMQLPIGAIDIPVTHGRLVRSGCRSMRQEYGYGRYREYEAKHELLLSVF